MLTVVFDAAHIQEESSMLHAGHFPLISRACYGMDLSDCLRNKKRVVVQWRLTDQRDRSSLLV